MYKDIFNATHVCANRKLGFGVLHLKEKLENIEDSEGFYVLYNYSNKINHKPYI